MWGYSRAASHPSDTDLEGMTPENVYVIVSVNDRLREVPWNYNDDGSLSGTTDDHYFRLTAYTVTATGEPRRDADPLPLRHRLRRPPAARGQVAKGSQPKSCEAKGRAVVAPRAPARPARPSIHTTSGTEY